MWPVRTSAAIIMLLTPLGRAELSARPVVCPAALPAELCLGAESFVGLDANWGRYMKRTPLAPSLSYIRDQLQSAVEIEHSTIPLYLTAMYSMTNTSSFAYSTVQGVVIEEMLHMTTAANVLNAIGGRPAIDQPNFIPHFPMHLPSANISASIRQFSPVSVRNFMEIERPTKMLYEKSITAVYMYILKMLQELCTKFGEKEVFVGDPMLQVTALASFIDEQALPVYTLDDAVAALVGVSDQGGGCPVDGNMNSNVTNTSAGALGGGLAHFARFTELFYGRQYGVNDTAQTGPVTGPAAPTDFVHVYKFTANPSISDFNPKNKTHATALKMSRDFAKSYTQLLVALHNVFNGQPETLMQTLGNMYSLKGQALALMQTPDPRYAANAGRNKSEVCDAAHKCRGIGPPWEYLPADSAYFTRPHQR